MNIKLITSKLDHAAFRVLGHGHGKIARLFLLCAIALLVQAANLFAGDKGNPNPKVLPPQSHPFGKSHSDWVIAQSKWAFEAPMGKSPLTDMEDCADGEHGQTGPVWYLAAGINPVKHCSVPTGKAIFVPVAGAFCSIAEGAGATEEELRECAQFWHDLNTVIILEVDGVLLQDPRRYDVTTPMFTINWPEGNLGGLPPGPDSLVSVGTFIILAPLPKGQHTIRRHVEATDGWVSDRTWHLTIE